MDFGWDEINMQSFENLLLCMYSECNKEINMLDVWRSCIDFFNKVFYPRFWKNCDLISCANKQIQWTSYFLGVWVFMIYYTLQYWILTKEHSSDHTYSSYCCSHFLIFYLIFFFSFSDVDCCCCIGRWSHANWSSVGGHYKGFCKPNEVCFHWIKFC